MPATTPTTNTTTTIPTFGSITPRTDQWDLILQTRQKFAEGIKRLLLIASTGFGKTVLLAIIVKLMLDKNPRATAAIALDSVALIRSTIRTLLAVGLHPDDISVVQGQPNGSPVYKGVRNGNSGARVFIVMLQTLEGWIDNEAEAAKLDQLPNRFTLGFLDECHDTKNRVAGQWLMSACDREVGLTATPISDPPIGRYYRHAIAAPTHADNVRAGRLRLMKYIVPDCLRKEDETQDAFAALAGEELPDISKHLLRDPEILAKVIGESEQAISAYAEANNGEHSTAIFCRSQAEAKELATAWQQATGIQCGYILSEGCGLVGFEGTLSRHEMILALEDGVLLRLFSVRAISKGFDVPKLSVIILLARMNFTTYTQALGRAVRLYPPCSHSLAIDWMGNLATANNPGGHPQLEQIEWDIDQVLQVPEPREKGPAITKNCPTCNAVLAISARTCGTKPEISQRLIKAGRSAEVKPGCGYTYPAADFADAINLDDHTLREHHTSLWVELAPDTAERNHRFNEAVRAAWQTIRTENAIGNRDKFGPPNPLSNLRAWANQFTESIREGDPTFEPPTNAFTFATLGNSRGTQTELQFLFSLSMLYSADRWLCLALTEVGIAGMVTALSPSTEIVANSGRIKDKLRPLILTNSLDKLAATYDPTGLPLLDRLKDAAQHDRVKVAQQKAREAALLAKVKATVASLG